MVCSQRLDAAASQVAQGGLRRAQDFEQSIQPWVA